VAVTLLFPFVAIRVLGREKETGALRMLIQLPYRPSTLIIAKVAAIAAAWWLASIPALCSLVMWKASSGHLCGLETSNLLFGNHIGQRRYRSHHHARFHDRLVGSRFHRRGPTRPP
jgi:hypothetical protein